LAYNDQVTIRPPFRTLVFGPLLCAGGLLLAQIAVAQTVRSGAGGAMPTTSPKPAAAIRTAATKGVADAMTTVENMMVTLLADYEYQLGRGIIFQSQGWYPTFSLIHAEQDIAIRWEGDRAADVSVTMVYAKRGLDSGILLPEQIGFLLPETEAWFLAVTARRVTEALEKSGKGSPSVIWEIFLPLLDAEGEMVFQKRVTAVVPPAESKGDAQALAKRLQGLLVAKQGKP
jgi:hypothetical protein